MRFLSALRRSALVLGTFPLTVAAQVRAVCPSDRVQPFFGWTVTECVNCSIYGSYFEYLTEPKIRDIQPGGPGAGKLRENDMLVSVDGAALTTPTAWHRLRDARAGDTVRLGVRREGALVETSIIASTRCGESNAANARSRSSFPSRFPARDSTGRRFTLGETTVEVDGPTQAVMYDARAGDVVLRINGTVVRIHAKVP